MLFAVGGIHNFKISVGNVFDGTFTPGDFTDCLSYEGFPIAGMENVFNCDTPQKGRYVAVYADYADGADAIQICDLNVHVMGGRFQFE